MNDILDDLMGIMEEHYKQMKICTDTQQYVHAMKHLEEYQKVYHQFVDVDCALAQLYIEEMAKKQIDAIKYSIQK